MNKTRSAFEAIGSIMAIVACVSSTIALFVNRVDVATLFVGWAIYGYLMSWRNEVAAQKGGA